MRRLLIATALAIGVATSAAPAQACAVHEPLNLGSIRSADLVVVGRIVARRIYRGNDAVFTVAVDEVLRGRAGRTLAMRFDFGRSDPPPSRPGARFLIALGNPGAGALRAHTVLQHICSDPFFLPAASRQAIAARRLLPGRR
jgi:hypothetical protein